MMIELMTAMLALPQMVPNQTDYPSSALRKNQSAAAVLEMVVDPEGGLVDCISRATFGDEDLAEDICKLQSDAEMTAARDAEGNASYGVLRVLIRYSIIQTVDGRDIYRLQAPGYTHTVTGIRFRPGTRPPDFGEFEALVGETQNILSADAVLTVEALPGVEARALHQNLIVQVSHDGTVAQCQPDAKFDTSKHAAYAKTACSFLAGEQLEPLVVAGEPVAHVRRYEVQFSLPEPASQHE